jgi:CheY-like chemotaxis protein
MDDFYKMSMLTEASTKNKNLLIVDDEPQMLRLMQRFLKNCFDEIFCITDPVAATGILENNKITHVLCDFDLDSTANGMDFVVLWRREFPFIERAVIFSGALNLHKLKAPPEVDAVVSKNDGIETVRAVLLQGEQKR